MRTGSGAISFVGLGYVGLCTATVFAAKGIKIIGVDIDENRVSQLSKGIAPFHEPGLAPMLKNALRKGRMRFTTDISEITRAETTFVTVGTPSNKDGSIDLTFVKKAMEGIGSAVSKSDGYRLVVVKSTVTPGTTAGIVQPILAASSQKQIGEKLGLCSNPEFLAEGAAMKGTLRPDKIVIGGVDRLSGEKLFKLYKRVYTGKKIPTVITTPTTAEAIKYASNTFLATRVSTINTIADICQRLPDADVEVVARAIGFDPRIGPLYLKAGPGYGGSCFHKDLQALIAFGKTLNYDPVLLSAVEEVNQRQAYEIIELAKKLVGTLENRRIAVLGLSFKKDTDDVRESPSLRLIDELVKNKASVAAYDPMAIENTRKVLTQSVEFFDTSKSCLDDADCCVLMTEWDEFRKLKTKDFASVMKTPNIVDARRILDPRNVQGTNYLAVGLGSAKP